MKAWKADASCRQALAMHPRVFSPSYLSMVRVDEATGLLETVFFRLFEHLGFERYMRDQVKSELRYLSFVVLAMAASPANFDLTMVLA